MKLPSHETMSTWYIVYLPFLGIMHISGIIWMIVLTSYKYHVSWAMIRRGFVIICLETGILCCRPPQEITQAIRENLHERTKWENTLWWPVKIIEIHLAPIRMVCYLYFPLFTRSKTGLLYMSQFHGNLMQHPIDNCMHDEFTCCKALINGLPR